MHFSGNIETPIGPMTAIVNGDGALVRLDFVGDTRADAGWQPPNGIIPNDDAIAHVAAQITAYFRRELQVFDLALAPARNAFLREAWLHLAKVPYGTTITYGDLAQRLDRPTSARAIGRANAINPISIIVPCHRVIAANGKLTGYSGGLEKKAALLRLEGVNIGWDANHQGLLL